MGRIIPIIVAVVGAALTGCAKVLETSAERRNVAVSDAATSTSDEKECGQFAAGAGDVYVPAEQECAGPECCVRRYAERMEKEQQELFGRLDLISENMLKGHIGSVGDAEALRTTVGAMRASAGPAFTENHLSVLSGYAALATRYSVDMDEPIESLAGAYQDPDDYVAAIAVVVTLSTLGRLLEDVPAETALKKDITTTVDEVVPALLAGTIKVKAEGGDFRTGHFSKGCILINKVDRRSKIMSSFNVIVHESRHALQHMRGKRRRMIDSEVEAGRAQFAANGLLHDLHRRHSPAEVEAYLDDYVRFRTSYFRHYLGAAKCMGLEGPAAERLEGMIGEIAADARKVDGELYSELIGESQRTDLLLDYTRTLFLAEPFPYRSIDGVFGFIRDVPSCSHEKMEDIRSTGIERKRKSLGRNARRMRKNPHSLGRALAFTKGFKGFASCLFYLDKEGWNELMAESMDDLIFAREVFLSSKFKL